MSETKLSVYSALAANFLIAITKFTAAIVTGSSAMTSEGIHSLVDTGNEVLLLIGIRQSKKPPDVNRPFGYGKELYFWTFIVSVLIFGIGGGISFYEGITHLQHPHAIENPIWNYIVIAIAIMFDSASLFIATREFNRLRGGIPFFQAVKRSKDPTTFVVLFEDAADVVGLVIAFLGIFLGHLFNNPYFDGISSIIIGLLLTAVSALLARESRSLLMGEALNKKILDKIIQLSCSKPSVLEVHDTLSMYLGPEEVVLVLPITFRKELNVSDLRTTIQHIKEDIRREFPVIKRIFIEPVNLEYK